MNIIFICLSTCGHPGMDGARVLALLLVVRCKRQELPPAAEVEARDLEAGSSNPWTDWWKLCKEVTLCSASAATVKMLSSHWRPNCSVTNSARLWQYIGNLSGGSVWTSSPCLVKLLIMIMYVWSYTQIKAGSLLIKHESTCGCLKEDLKAETISRLIKWQLSTIFTIKT